MEVVVLIWRSYCSPVSSQVSIILLHFFPVWTEFLALGIPRCCLQTSVGHWNGLGWISPGWLQVWPWPTPLEEGRCGKQPFSGYYLLSNFTVFCSWLSWLKQMATQALSSLASSCDLNGKMCWSTGTLLPSALLLGAWTFDVVKKMRAVLTSASVWFELSCFVRQSP